ncbi:GtrA family protein [Pararhizobium mangrovi]|uniref:GtrA family protein n=1 Tax=Pararhizobium mangrovi TaxID=2590452 RepID=A0A506U0D0_9HYPH|nr:GtrA family protein [Pararhizobium mangrovi]TPW26434.1 GtrA family protein [Pararhizobium mangrovi]
MKKLFSFLIAGGVGFAVDVAVLMVLLHIVHMDVYSARFIAIGCALGCTWLINRNFTFDRSAHSLAVEGARYWSVGLSSALVNYCAYSALMMIDGDIPPVIALMVSSGCATLLSYTGYSRFVFRR